MTDALTAPEGKVLFALPLALRERAKEGALAHAYILRAQDPEALESAARAVAAALVCQGDAPPCGGCKGCRKAAKGVHPDVIAVERKPDKREIVVDQVRALRSDAYIRPNEAKRKVYLIREAHLMNEEAQNAFLKVLEDGPAYAAFLLLTPTPDALLPTIRSRCETIRAQGAAGPEDPALAGRADELAGLLLAGDRWGLTAWCAGHEKDKREEAAALLEETRRALLRRRDEKTTPRAVRLAEALGGLKGRLDGNGNVGCVLGLLWAEAARDG